MKTLIAFCCLLLICVSGVAQEKTRKTDADTYSVSLVRDLVKMQDKGFSVSYLEKEHGRLGDRVSIALLKIYDEASLIDPHSIKQYLPVIRAAFITPELVTLDADRKPKVTMVLLSYLKREVNNEQTKAQISEVMSFIKEQTK